MRAEFKQPPNFGGGVLSSEVGAVFIGGIDVALVGDSRALQDALDNDADVRRSVINTTNGPCINLLLGYRF